MAARRRARKNYLPYIASGVLVALYVPMLAGLAALLLVPEDGALRVVAFIATVVASDVGGYAVGVLIGKHPMAPTISPKKSWEGMGGSIGACMIVASADPPARLSTPPVTRASCSAPPWRSPPPWATWANR